MADNVTNPTVEATTVDVTEIVEKHIITDASIVRAIQDGSLGIDAPFAKDAVTSRYAYEEMYAEKEDDNSTPSPTPGTDPTPDLPQISDGEGDGED